MVVRGYSIVCGGVAIPRHELFVLMNVSCVLSFFVLHVELAY